MVIERVLSHLAHVYGGKRWLLGVEVAQAATPTCRRLRGWGCPPPFVVAGRSGSGPVPGADEALLTLLGRPPLPMMEAIHDAEEALRALPPEVQAAIDAWDPDRSAGALGAFFSDGRPIGGRPFFGARPAAWRRLEDKVAIDAVWDAAGVERAPSLLRPLEPGAVASAHATLDRGLGTVWSGDAERGFHGGATYTVHVPDGSAVDAAVAHLRTRCTTARGMPFLEGIPCSAHGIVFPDGVVVLRPAEMVVLRGGRTGFVYFRGGTCWDPPAARREELRALVRRVGVHLRATLGYRGAFTVDGVMTADGFRPTELNPRVGAALGMMHGGLPFSMLSDALVEGLVPEVDPAALELELLTHADANRVGSLGVTFAVPLPETTEHTLSWTGAGWVEAEAGDAQLRLGPGPSGGYANLSLVPPPVGESLAPRAAALATWLDRHVGTDFGPLVAAREA
jgi:hypothetical protein